MEIKEIVKKIENSLVYKKWKEKNSDFYLVHLFFDDNPPQVGYYSPKKDSIVTFVADDEVTMNPESEVFKEKKIIKELVLSDVKLKIAQINQKTKTFVSENYKNELISKNILILQVLENNPIYNVTYFTKAFKTLNIKIDAKTGEIVSHELSNLIGL